MGLSRRSIVFGKGKRLPSSSDCAENTLRILNIGQYPSVSTFRELNKSPIESPSRLISESGGDEEDSRDNNVEINELSTDAEAKKLVAKRKVVTNWSTDEVMSFYEGLTEYGKNFEQIAALLVRKKFANKDKHHCRNFYNNTFKMYKEKAGIEEQEWRRVPNAARELLIVINALEWRKKTHTTNVNPQRFNGLIMNGVTNVKVAGKRVVTLRTPNCTALHKFFPCRLYKCSSVDNSLFQL
jgi:hypothetical protein